MLIIEINKGLPLYLGSVWFLYCSAFPHLIPKQTLLALSTQYVQNLTTTSTAITLDPGPEH